MSTIRNQYNIGTIELDPKHAFEKSKNSILGDPMLKLRFMAICKFHNLCSKSIASEVYSVVLTKTVHARSAVVFRFWKEQYVKKNGNATLCVKLKAQCELKSKRRTKRAKLNSDGNNNAQTPQFSDMIVKELKAAYRERDLAVGGKKAELLERLYKYVAEQISTIATPASELSAVTLSE